MSNFFWNRFRPTPNRCEEQVVDAVMRLCEALVGENAETICTPDKIDRNRPAVDRHFTLGDKRYAVEHTAIQTFDKEHSADAVWRNVLDKHIEKVEDCLSQALPNDSDWELWISANINGLKSNNVSELIKYIKEWVLIAGPSLGHVFPENVISGRVKIERRAFRIRLGRYPLGFCGHRSPKRFHIERMLFHLDESKERHAAINRAFQKKSQKLVEEKKSGSFVILALEWTSPLATPAIPILYAARLLDNTFQSLVDRVVVVSTNDDVWSLQYHDCGGDVSRDIFKHNWWLYNPIDQSIWQRLWK